MQNLRKREAEYHIETNYKETVNKYTELFNLKNIGPNPEKNKLIHSIETYFTAEIPFKPSDILGVISIIVLAEKEKETYENIFYEIVRIMMPEKMEDFDSLRNNIYVNVLGIGKPLQSNHVNEIKEKIEQKKASKDEVKFLITHYVSYIAYYKVYINWIYEHCLQRDDYVELSKQQRELFDPVSFYGGILNSPAAGFYELEL